jgi:hypothetical protein
MSLNHPQRRSDIGVIGDNYYLIASLRVTGFQSNLSDLNRAQVEHHARDSR